MFFQSFGFKSNVYRCYSEDALRRGEAEQGGWVPCTSQDADASLPQKIETFKNWRGSVRSVLELPAGRWFAVHI